MAKAFPLVQNGDGKSSLEAPSGEKDDSCLSSSVTNSTRLSPEPSDASAERAIAPGWSRQMNVFSGESRNHLRTSAYRANSNFRPLLARLAKCRAISSLHGVSLSHISPSFGAAVRRAIGAVIDAR